MRQKAFSLLEILIVIAVLAILLAIGLYVSARPSTPSTTRVTLIALKQIMLDYESRNAPLTTVNIPDPTRTWVTALRANPKTAQQIEALELSADSTQILDGYGNPIRFTPADASPTKQFYFQSPGPDAQFNTTDDVYSP